MSCPICQSKKQETLVYNIIHKNGQVDRVLDKRCPDCHQLLYGQVKTTTPKSAGEIKA